MSLPELRAELKQLSFEAPLESFPSQVLGSLRTNRIRLPGAFALLRSWSQYASNAGVESAEPYSLRSHIERFANTQFARESMPTEVHSVPLTVLEDKLEFFTSLLPNAEVLYDPQVALRGGAARTALKILCGVDHKKELPLHDIDILASTHPGAAYTSSQYGADLAGIEYIAGDLRDAFGYVFANSDCTMNQVAIHAGRIYFTDQALEDIKYGAIRLVGAVKPLFPADSVKLPDGHIFIERPGFYRGLSFLIRGKGSTLVVSQENIDEVAPTIGRYWLIMLGVKIMALDTEHSQKTAVGHWHDLAVRLRCTETTNPSDFLVELREAYPDTRKTINSGTSAGNTNPDNEVRWILSKLISRCIESLEGKPVPTYPSTYSEANLRLSSHVPDYDFQEFLRNYRNID